MKRIFIVEDEALVALALKDYLGGLGYEICGHALKGEVALQQIPEARPDLILMDINLGRGLSGLEVAERLRGVLDVPIILLTAYSDTAITSVAAKSGSFAFVVKPFEPAVLAANIELALVRQEATVALRESKRRYRSLFEEAIEGVFRTQIDGTIIDVNPAFLRIVGARSTEELQGTSILDLYATPQDRERFGKAHAGRLSIEGFEVQWRRRDGVLIDVELFGRTLTNERGEPSLYQGFLRDVTKERARAARERLLLEHKEQLELVIEGTRLGFWDWNLQTNAVTFNDRWAEMLGYSADELTPTIETYRELLHPDDLPAWETLMQEHLQGARPYFETVLRLRHRSGQWLHVLSRGKVFSREHGGVAVRFCGTHTDITREKEAEQAAREASRAKTHFLANMSHELRTPLNAVLGLSEALIDSVYGPLNARQQRSLMTIHQSGRHLLELINDVLDIARIEAGRLSLDLQDVVLSQLIGECVAFVLEMASARDQQVQLSLDSQVRNVRADPRRLKQVVLNLLTNACKFSPPGALITVGTSRSADGESLEIWVADPGPGIAPADRERVFEPFLTLEQSIAREHHGAGLGLALVKQIVELHQGAVRIEDSSTGGARFVVTLPARRREERHSSPRFPRPATALRPSIPTSVPEGRRLLLVEDDEANIQTVGGYLHEMGFEVEVVRDGNSAVAAAAATEVALVLMDIQLPGLDGIEVTRRVRATPSGATKPIIALTSSAMAEDEERCRAAGATAFLAKPVGLKTLLQVIQGLLPEEGARV